MHMGLIIAPNMRINKCETFRIMLKKVNSECSFSIITFEKIYRRLPLDHLNWNCDFYNKI